MAMHFHRIMSVIGAFCFCAESGAQTGNLEFTKTRLGFWRFNRNEVRGEQGQQPLLQTNFVTVISTNYDGTALRISEADPRVALRYGVVEPGGRTNINFRQGSIRLRYKPVWDGAGPGHWARLLEIGHFALSIDPSGQILSFQSPDPSGGVSTNVQAPITSYVGTSPGDRPWMDIAVSYSADGSALIVNGSKVAKGTGIVAAPSELVQKVGFAVGSAAGGGLRASGLIDDFETFNFPMGPMEWNRWPVTMSASVSSDPLSVHLFWESKPNSIAVIQRRALGETNWTKLVTNRGFGEFVDASPGLRPGRRYEYRTTADIVVGVNDVAAEHRGRVILLVDQTIASPLAKELTLLQSDLMGDGWIVTRHDVPRHDDANRMNNIANVARIKSQIVADYNADLTNTWALFVIGHVTIPYSGAVGPDGHGLRPFPTDIYYGDVDGVWTDVQVHPRVPNPVWNNNDPGDGIYDQASVPTNRAGIRRLEIPVGRVDFARMPAFSRPPGQLAPKSETDLLRQYLEKDHRYRHGQTDIKRRVIAAGFIPGEGHQLNQQNFSGALGNGSRWYGSQPDSLVEADLFQATTPAQWGFAVGYGGPSQISVYSVTNLPNPVRQPLVDFYMLDGSYFGEWNFDDNLLRGVLAMPKHGLASMWSRAIVWRLEELALGEPLSSAILTTANSPWFSQGTPVYFAVLGDPTLRLEVTPPPTKLTVARRQQQVRLNWGASPATNVTYDVFRRLQRVETPFQRLNANPIDGLAFTDSDPPSGAKLYQVRARSLVRTGSGSYTNLSQGVFVSVR